MAPPIVKAMSSLAPVTRSRPMITAAAIPCATKNTMVAINPSDVETRAGGEASGSSRKGRDDGVDIKPSQRHVQVHVLRFDLLVLVLFERIAAENAERHRDERVDR